MSFEIALSGINAVSSQLSGISNNIANASTYGYKMGRTNFSAVYVGAQAMGVGVGSTQQDIGRGGSLTSTGRMLDAAIDGKGFFITRGADGANQYTRVGIFNTDKDGFLVDSYGRKVQGFNMSATGAQGALGDIQVPTGQIPAMPSDALKYAGNMSAGWDVPANAFDAADPSTFNASSVSTVYDSRGEKHTVTQYFVKKDDNTVSVHYALNGNPLAGTTSELTFDAKGQLTGGTSQTLTLTGLTGAADITLNLDYTGTTMFAGEHSTTANAANGYASGAMTGVRIESNGEITAQYSNGQKMAVGVVALATFPNEQGLAAASDTSWTDTPASGAALISTPGSGTVGQLAAGVLEGSNVDLTAEMVNLMTAQRNYQANTKVISTQSQVVQALMQAI